jgi:hypothetical protein
MRLSVTALVLTVPLLSSQLDDFQSETRLITVFILWAIWAGLLLSMLVPSSSTLTALRLLAPAHTATTLIVVSASATDSTSQIADSQLADSWTAILALAISVIATVAALSGDTGRYYVQLSAYGDERRFLLSCPMQMAIIQVVTWMVWFVTGAISVIALTGDAAYSLGRLLVGLTCGAIAVLGCVVLPRRFHRFSRRWLVWVPAGIVLHDHVVLAETAMMSSRSIQSVKLWRAGDEPEPLNATGGRMGRGIVVTLRDLETIIFSATPEHPGGRALHVQSFLIRPTRLQPALNDLTTRLSGR